MVWVVSDEAMEQIFGGDFVDIFVASEYKKDITIKDLQELQDKYKSYMGFYKFFNRHIKPILKSTRYIEDVGIIGKIVNYFAGIKRYD